MDGDLVKTIGKLIERVERLLTRQKLSAPTQRILIALAGVPGSGKTTLSDALIKELEKNGISDVAVLPMVSDQHILKSPTPSNTFVTDIQLLGWVSSYSHLSLFLPRPERSISKTREPLIIIKAPGFDHAKKDPIPNAIKISSRAQVVIIEGNYVLLHQDPWSRISTLVDDKWFVDVPVDIARERLASRHLRAGIETTTEAAIKRADENDIPNGEYIRSHLLEPNARIIN
ncbi:panthothenate kinase uridine kinase-related [Fusarium subglutinans]|uniref:Panthothenate kinase uridine kinase-related n=1 Tax=Gibberella subglutinans TaxID=42677 RepID=A0A8H5PHX4_GIBSU|nr:panthothenate kinase uridine kinase-related [Fusarium subglutinans]KAF5596661.1 panthothenate kinase uridine kinase-related [Fusarium subglutinans]